MCVSLCVSVQSSKTMVRYYKLPILSCLVFSFTFTDGQLSHFWKLTSLTVVAAWVFKWLFLLRFHKTQEMFLACATKTRIICSVLKCDNDPHWYGLQAQLLHQKSSENWDTRLICQYVDLHTDSSCTYLQNLLKVVLELSEQIFCTASE